MVLPALTSDEQTALNGPSTRKTYLSVISDDDALVTTLTVNQASLPFPLTQLTVTGTITNVKAGMEAVVSRSGTEIGRYRVRLDATTATLYVMEQGRADPGALAYLLRPTGISNGDTIKIYDRKNLYSVLPRIVLSNPETLGSIYEDFDAVPGIQNSFPSPICNMSVNTSRGGYFATRVQDGATVPISATVTVLHWATSISATYAWSVPGAWTGVSGTSSATLTGTAPIGNWKLECTVTPNVGNAFTITRRVHIHGVTENPPILLMDGTFSDTRDRTGRRISFSLLDNTIVNVPHTSMCMVFDDSTWNGSASSVPTATRIFVGWLSHIGFTIDQQTRQAAPEIVGPAGILELLGNTSQLFEVKNLATTWQEMTYSTATFSWVIWWLMKIRAANLLSLFNYWPISTARDVGRLPAFKIPAGSLLSQLKGVAHSYREANFGFNSGGEAFVRVHPSMTPVGDRGDIPTRDVLTSNKYTLPLSWDQALRPTTRQVQGGAFVWDGVSPLPTTVRSDAPEKPGQGTSDDTWQDQIVESQSVINVLTGLRFAMLNNPVPQAPSFVIPHNRDVYEPAEMPRVEAVIPADKMPTEEAWDFFGVPMSVTDGRFPNGATQITLTLEPETSGDEGVTIPIAPPGSNLNPDLPPVDEIPFQPIPDLDWGPDIDYDPDTPTPLNPQPGAPAEYGRMLSATSDNRVQRLTWPSGTFTLADVSPSANFRTLLGTAFKLHRDQQNPKQAFLVGSKAILRCADWMTATPKWSAPVSLGVGVVDIDNMDGTHTVTFDFAAGPCGFNKSFTFYKNGGGAYVPATPINSLNYSAGGWTTIESQHPTALLLGYSSQEVAIGRPITIPCTLREITLEWVPNGANHSSTLQLGPMVNGTFFAGGYGNTSQNFTPATATYALNIPVMAGDFVGWNAYYSANVAPVDSTTFTRMSLTYDFSGQAAFAISDDVIVSDFQSSPCRDRQNAYYWFIKRPESGTDYLWLKRTFDNFKSTSETRIARYSADIVPSIAIDSHNWKFVYVTAGDPAEDDCYLYESTDGGGAFSATPVAILAHGGQLCWNWSTSTPNAHNNSKDNLIIVRGLDGSNNLLARRGLAGSDVTIATGSGKYGLSPQALWVLPKDLDFVRLALSDGDLRVSSNAAGSFSSATAIPGVTPAGLDAWPTGSQFNVLWGEQTLAFTTDSGSSYTDLYSTFATWAASTYGGGNDTIVGVVIDISTHYSTPVLGGG